MSRVMYTYRLPKCVWWEFASACRKAYAEEHPIPMIMTKAAQSARELSAEDKASKLGSILEAIRKSDEWMVDLQLFDEGDTYLIRPLERGYFFLNNHERWTRRFGLEPVFYDDRSDVPPEQEKNRDVSLWCDDKIERGEYLLYQVVEQDNLSNTVFNILMGGEPQNVAHRQDETVPRQVAAP